MMEADQLNIIEARENALAKGAWTTTADTSDEDGLVDLVYDARGRVVAKVYPNELICEGFQMCQCAGRFIAAARTDIPLLVAEIRRLRKIVEKLPKTAMAALQAEAK